VLISISLLNQLFYQKKNQQFQVLTKSHLDNTVLRRLLLAGETAVTGLLCGQGVGRTAADDGGDGKVFSFWLEYKLVRLSLVIRVFLDAFLFVWDSFRGVLILR
jgi:hypothetical protein